MIGANVVPFDETLRDSGADVRYITDEALRSAQPVVDLADCHVAFDRCSVIMKTKTANYPVFRDLSATFPKGRRMAILGHKGSGKTVLVDMILGRRSVRAGRVIVNSRVSWSVSFINYLDGKLSLKQNLLFIARVFQVDPSMLMAAACETCGLVPKQLMEQVISLPIMMKRRISLLIYLIADFDLHIIDGPFRPVMFGTMNDRLQEMITAVTSRDYLATVVEPRQLPQNCDLAYILYHGRLYVFEDVDEAITIYNALPEPENPNPFAGKDEGEDEGGGDDAGAFGVI